MSLLPTWPIAAGALVAGLVVGAGADHLYMDAKLSREQARYTKLENDHKEQERLSTLKRAEDERAARDKEQQMAARAGQIEQEKTNEIARIRADSAAAIARLSNRPDRKPASTGGVPSAAPACAGSTGAELSSRDSVFLAGLAARADEHRAALQACYRWADEVTNRSQSDVDAQQGD